MDEIDRAQQRQAEDIDQALAKHRARRADDAPGPALIDARTGATLCWDCNDPIQPERLRALPTAHLCVDCQVDHDRRRRADPYGD